MNLESDSWKQQNPEAKKPTGQVTDFNRSLVDLASLVTSTSIVGGNSRNIAISNEVITALTEFKKSEEKTTISSQLKAILPDVIKMDSNLSPTLPGVICYVKVGQSLLFAPFLFSNREVLQDLEEVNFQPGSMHATMTGVTSASLRKTPYSYMSSQMVNDIKANLLARFKPEGVTSTIPVVCKVIDLESYPKAENEKALVEQIKLTILSEWESGVRACITKETVKSNNSLGTPFLNAKGEAETNAFGPSRHSVVKIESVNNLLINGTPSGCNAAVRMQTSKKNDWGNASPNEVSREIVTAYLTVSLTGIPYQAYAANMSKINQTSMIALGLNGGYMNGYTPLQPVITCSSVKAGPQMGFNNGLASLLLGLYAAMTINHNYLFTEAIRRPTVGARGNLSHIQPRIKEMLQMSSIPYDPKMDMTEAKLKDMDFVNEWIKRNVAKYASFGADLVNFGTDSAVHNFLSGLVNNSIDSTINKRVIVSLLDSMTNNNAATVLQNHIDAKEGWNLEKPVLHSSNIMKPVGTWTYNGEIHSLEEIDEMAIYRFCGDNPVLVQKYLAAMYGDGQNTPLNIRQYIMTTNLPNILGCDVNITGFSTLHYWDPEFCAYIGKVFSVLGTINSSGSMGNLAANMGVFAPSVAYAIAAAGNSSGFTQFSNEVSANPSGIIYGV